MATLSELHTPGSRTIRTGPTVVPGGPEIKCRGPYLSLFTWIILTFILFLTVSAWFQVSTSWSDIRDLFLSRSEAAPPFLLSLSFRCMASPSEFQSLYRCRSDLLVPCTIHQGRLAVICVSLCLVRVYWVPKVVTMRSRSFISELFRSRPTSFAVHVNLFDLNTFVNDKASRLLRT